MEKEAILETGKIEGANPISILDQADSINRSLQENIKKYEELIAKQEHIAARLALSGKSEAGFSSPSPAPPLSDIDYSKRFFNEGKL